MRFLLDARLPLRLAQWLRQTGHDARQTLELPDGNRTPDASLVAPAMRKDRVVVTKDNDFVQTFLLSG